MRRALMLGGVLLALTGSCDLDPLEPPKVSYQLEQDLEVTQGIYQVRVDASTLTLSLLRDQETLLSFPPDAFVLGTVLQVEDEFNFNPYPVVIESGIGPKPVDLAWRGVVDAKLVEERTDGFTLRLFHDGGPESELEVNIDGEGRFGLRFVPAEASVATVGYLRLRPRTSTSEGFYGLGEYFDNVDHRGHIRAMQLEPDGSVESSNNEAHVPVPLLIGTNGWGLFVESPYPAAFDVATQADDLVEVTFGTGTFSDEGLHFHLLAAEHPLDVTQRYYEITGYPRLPAPWALGPWIWRDENMDQAQIESDLNTIRDLDLATTGYWIDRPYATAVNTFDFSAEMFTDADAALALADDLGFKVALWHTPYLDEESDATADLIEQAEASGYYPPQSGLLLNNWGKPIDLTNPDAYAWWQDLIRRYTERGIVGFKLDYMEDIIPSLLAARNVWSFADGSDERTQHSRFQVLYHQVYAETLPEEGGFLLCRSGTYGDQVNGTIIWPGDLNASFANHLESVEGKNLLAVGGLPASVVAGLTLGPSGFPFYGSDTGGYRDSPPDKETFVRWFEQTALSTVMQVGTSSNNVAWEFDQNDFDQESLDWYRIYTRLHLRLWPYLWTLAENLADDGRPIQRALGLAYPELGIHPDHIYMLGDDLLVAPVVSRGQREQVVPLPPGSWTHFWSGKTYGGNTEIEVDAPLGELPLFVRDGAVVPMLRPTIDTLNPTKQPNRVDSFAASPNGSGPGVLWVLMTLGDGSKRTVYDGTQIATVPQADGWMLVSEPGDVFQQGVVFEVMAVSDRPIAVQQQGMAMEEVADLAALEQSAGGWFYEQGRGGVLYVKVGDGDREVVVVP